jgi:hypothetical protein
VYRKLPLAAVCCVALAAALRADGPPAVPATDPAVQKWVEQLGDSDYRKRDEAGRLLLTAGDKALPALRQALNDPDAEVRRRANDLLPAVESAVLVAPKRVTFKTTNKPVKDAFDELMRQTNYHIEYSLNDPNKAYTFDFQDVPFWEALDRISRATGLALQQGYGDDHVRLYQQDAYPPYVHYQGAFRFMATGFNQYRNIDFSLVGKGAPQPNRSESLTLMFAVFVEPRMALLGVGQPHLDAAYDNEKNSLLVPVGPDPFNNPGMIGRWTSGKYGNGNRMYSTQSQVNLVRPSDRATAVKVVRGSLPVTLLVNEKEVVVTDKLAEAKGLKAQAGDTQFVIDEVTEMPNVKQYQIKMSITEDLKSGDPNDYSWVNSLYQRIEVLDAKGNRMQMYQSQWNNQTANHFDMLVTYGSTPGAKPEAPAKLVYRTWATRQEVIPFEFKDLPLP